MTGEPSSLEPIDALDALEAVEARLLELLDQLSTEDWDRATMVKRWRVRHIAGHLLDTALRKVSIVRDGFAIEGPSSAEAGDLRRFIDRLNAEGVSVYGRLSRDVLAAQMRVASQQLCSLHRAMDPQAPAVFAVSWAGDVQSPNWFDTARELTERWHHQQQIRLAVGRPGIMTPELYHPVLDCFMRSLPHTYRDVTAPVDTGISVNVTGACGGSWYLVRGESRWTLQRHLEIAPASTITISQDLAWRVFTKGVAREDAELAVTIEGDRELGCVVLNAVAIVG